jgi:hypothetical protein
VKSGLLRPLPSARFDAAPSEAGERFSHADSTQHLGLEIALHCCLSMKPSSSQGSPLGTYRGPRLQGKSTVAGAIALGVFQ